MKVSFLILFIKKTLWKYHYAIIFEQNVAPAVCFWASHFIPFFAFLFSTNSPLKTATFHNLDKHSNVFLCFFCFRPTVPLKLLLLFRKSSKLCSRLSAVHVFKKTCTALKREHHFHCLTPFGGPFRLCKTVEQSSFFYFRHLLRQQKSCCNSKISTWVEITFSKLHLGHPVGPSFPQKELPGVLLASKNWISSSKANNFSYNRMFCFHKTLIFVTRVASWGYKTYAPRSDELRCQTSKVSSVSRASSASKVSPTSKVSPGILKGMSPGV